mmetsp:Transcript_22464/g.37554  ORF Transcript_22464/g.37554 Transcript_22464/m.37554 type:complete len:105 (+) Transcript_22464:1572-1886(+)
MPSTMPGRGHQPPNWPVMILSRATLILSARPSTNAILVEYRRYGDEFGPVKEVELSHKALILFEERDATLSSESNALQRLHTQATRTFKMTFNQIIGLNRTCKR